MLKRVVARVAVVAVMFGIGASAQQHVSGYPETDPKDKLVPANAAPPLAMWKGIPVWEAMSDCSAWHMMIKNSDTTKKPDADGYTFFGQLMTQLQKDRGMEPRAAGDFAMHWMKVGGGLRVSGFLSSMEPKDLDTNCAAVLKYSLSLNN